MKSVAKLASQKPPGIVTVVFPNPPPMSSATGVVADAQPQAPPPARTMSKSSVLIVVPPTVIVRSALDANASRAAWEPSDGFPDVSVVIVVAATRVLSFLPGPALGLVGSCVVPSLGA